MITNPDVVWVCHPEGSWSGVSIQDAVRSSHSNNEVVGHVVGCFDAILDEDVVALAVVIDVPFNSQVVDSMDGSATVEGVVYGIASHIGLGDLSDHVEVNWVAANLERLPNIVELHVLEPSYDSLITWGMKHDCCSVLVFLCGLWISLIENISGQQTDLSSELDCVSAVSVNGSVVLV